VRRGGEDGGKFLKVSFIGTDGFDVGVCLHGDGVLFRLEIGGDT